MLYATRCCAAAGIVKPVIANLYPDTVQEAETSSQIDRNVGGPGKLKLISLLGSGFQNRAITLHFSISNLSKYTPSKKFFTLYFFY